MNIMLFEELLSRTPVHLPYHDERARHIIKVLRLAVGDTVRVGVINGWSGKAEILAIDTSGIDLFWEPDMPPAPLHPVTLLVGQVRPICMKRILREAVSIGVDRIFITGTDLGERSYRDAKLWSTGEFRSYLVSGAEQAGAVGIPQVQFFDRLDSFLGRSGSAGEEGDHDGIEDSGESTDKLFITECRILLDLVPADRSLSRMFLPPAERYLLAVGSERGWSDRERTLMRGAGFMTAGIGERILRTETACAVGTALLLSRLNRL